MLAAIYFNDKPLLPANETYNVWSCGFLANELETAQAWSRRGDHKFVSLSVACRRTGLSMRTVPLSGPRINPAAVLACLTHRAWVSPLTTLSREERGEGASRGSCKLLDQRSPTMLLISGGHQDIIIPVLTISSIV
jgi:hypothetical protein